MIIVSDCTCIKSNNIIVRWDFYEGVHINKEFFCNVTKNFNELIYNFIVKNIVNGTEIIDLREVIPILERIGEYADKIEDKLDKTIKKRKEERAENAKHGLSIFK